LSRKRKSNGPGNIKAEMAYDPFPKSGLVKQYEPLIRKRASEFCERYPQRFECWHYWSVYRAVKRYAIRDGRTWISRGQS
jgi:hypothetical protein